MDLRASTIATGQTFVTVLLSERNLKDLLAQVEQGSRMPQLVRRCDEGFLTVQVQSDDEHYEKRVAGPGSGLL
jgi:hypothetical protein